MFRGSATHPLDKQLFSTWTNQTNPLDLQRNVALENTSSVKGKTKDILKKNSPSQS